MVVVAQEVEAHHALSVNEKVFRKAKVV